MTSFPPLSSGAGRGRCARAIVALLSVADLLAVIAGIVAVCWPRK